MNTARITSVLIIFTFFSSCSPISMKVKSCIYDFINNLKNVDTSNVVCEESGYAQAGLWETLISDPKTKLALAKYSLFSSVIYIDKDIIKSIRKNFTVSEDIKYALLYRIGLLKIIRAKSITLGNPVKDLSIISVLLSFISFEISFFQWYDNRCVPGDPKLSAKFGIGLLALSSVLGFIDQKTQKQIDPEQDLLDTMEKADEFAKNTLSSVRKG